MLINPPDSSDDAQVWWSLLNSILLCKCFTVYPFYYWYIYILIYFKFGGFKFVNIIDSLYKTFGDKSLWHMPTGTVTESQGIHINITW